MKQRELSLLQMKEIYEKYLVKDFPKNEQKPFSSIERMYKEGKYQGFVLEEDGELRVYWLLLRKPEKKASLLDYLAVVGDKRGKGYGTKALQCILQSVPPEEVIVIEAENPEKAVNGQERQMQEKRLDFYRKNGVAFTGVTSRVFGADYVIMLLSRQKLLWTREEVRRLYLDFYENDILTKEKCEKHVTIAD